MTMDEITSETITGLVLKNVLKILKIIPLKSISKHFYDRKIKLEIDLKIAFENYLNHSKDRNEKVKTLLYPLEPKKLYSFYEPMDLSHGKKIIDITDFNKFLRISNNIIITGTGGIGKTMMMKYFFLKCISHEDYVPVLIELRGLNDPDDKNIPLIDFVYKKMQQMKLNLERKYFDYALKAGCFLILFDGYDEVTQTLRTKIARQINDMANEYNHNYFIVSSRSSDEFKDWNNFTELETVPLSKKKALYLINRLEYEEPAKTKFCKQLQSNLFEKYKTFASNPLLLSIMLLTFGDCASVPDKLNDFYEQAFDTLFHKHDGSKGGYKRNIASNLGYGDFKRIFSYFSFKSFLEDQYQFTYGEGIAYIEQAKSKIKPSIAFDSSDFFNDAITSVCMLVQEGSKYKFTHRSFQEYFAAVYICTLDDDEQKNIMAYWGKKTENCHNATFLHMLNAMQSKRVFKNFLKPVLVELDNFVLENKFSYTERFKFFFAKIVVCFFQDQTGKSIKITHKNSYYHKVILCTCHFYIHEHEYRDLLPPFQNFFDNIFNEVKLLDPITNENDNCKEYSSSEFVEKFCSSFIEQNFSIMAKSKFALDILHQYQKDNTPSKELNSESFHNKY